MKARSGHTRPPEVTPMQFYNGTPCIPWAGGVAPNGYGYVYVKNRKRPAHRAIYENYKGPVPDGLVMDHLCRNRCCVNPEHLEPVTDYENIMRGVGTSSKNARKTHCKRGHPLNAANVFDYGDGQRRCKTCKRETDTQKSRRFISMGLNSRGRKRRYRLSPKQFALSPRPSTEE